MNCNQWLVLAALWGAPSAVADDLTDRIEKMDWTNERPYGCKADEAQIMFLVTTEMKDVLSREAQRFYLRWQRPIKTGRWTKLWGGTTSFSHFDRFGDGKGFGGRCDGTITLVNRDGFTCHICLTWGFHGPGQQTEKMSASFPCRWVATQTFETNGLCVTVNTRTVERKLEPVDPPNPSQARVR